MRVVGRALVVPIAHHTRGEDHQGDERQRNREYAKRLLHGVMGQSKPGDGPGE
jgi:hypothetical protein